MMKPAVSIRRPHPDDFRYQSGNATAPALCRLRPTAVPLLLPASMTFPPYFFTCTAGRESGSKPPSLYPCADGKVNLVFPFLRCFRCLPERRLPDKAIDLLDEAASRVNLLSAVKAPELKTWSERLSAAQALALPLSMRTALVPSAIRNVAPEDALRLTWS